MPEGTGTRARGQHADCGPAQNEAHFNKTLRAGGKPRPICSHNRSQPRSVYLGNNGPCLTESRTERIVVGSAFRSRRQNEAARARRPADPGAALGSQIRTSAACRTDVSCDGLAPSAIAVVTPSAKNHVLGVTPKRRYFALAGRSAPAQAFTIRHRS